MFNFHKNDKGHLFCCNKKTNVISNFKTETSDAIFTDNFEC